MCTLRAPFCVQLFPHWSHVYGFSPVWILMCSLRVCLSLKLFPHWSHEYGFSPVWILVCPSRARFCLKLFPHWSHVYGFSPVWVFRCASRYSFCVKLFSTLITCVQLPFKMTFYVNIKILLAWEIVFTLRPYFVYSCQWGSPGRFFSFDMMVLPLFNQFLNLLVLFYHVYN